MTATATLSMHCGSKAATESRVRSIQAPDGTDTWVPIPHFELLDHVQEVMSEKGLVVDQTSKKFGLKRDDNQMFAVLKVISDQDKDFGLSVGLRNSTDKSLSAAMCFGSNVFVCDNLVFSGEQTLARKHTKNIRDGLRDMISDALDQADVFRAFNERLYASMKQADVTDGVVHDMVCRAFRADAIPVSRIKHVLDEWYKPSHPEFEPRNAWSMFNAFTESAKVGFARNPHTASQRTMRLTRLMQRTFAPTLVGKSEVPLWLTIN